MSSSEHMCTTELGGRGLAARKRLAMIPLPTVVQACVPFSIRRLIPTGMTHEAFA